MPTSTKGEAGVALPRPRTDSYTQPFFDALREKRLALPRCGHCGLLQLPVGPVCTHCLEPLSNWVSLSGRGTVASFVIYHHAYHPAFADKLPYNVALVKLDEGPQVISNIVDTANDNIRIGMPVEAVIEAVDDDLSLLRFRPATASD
jgi:uncharacterized OB-fold protein